MDSNPQLELAHSYVCNTGKNIFLTGKAGTGKTTFLHRIKSEAVKRMAVVAPTGVAAINAGGMTIHSLFQLPFGPLVPGAKKADKLQRKFSKKKINLLKSLDLLVIDEISMVRADLLDGIDEVLRRYRGHSQPFGGVQLLMIGDLHQLPPVVKYEEWEMLRQHYQTPYFFGSLALRKTNPVTIELKHIFRQSDEQFIALLNKVRDNKLDAEVMEKLNSRYRQNFQPKKEDGYITLTSHNAAAQQINTEQLAAIPGDSQPFKARIEGNFPAHAYPTDEVLELKVGAQVMFVKNDISAEKLFFNGKIGQVTRIDSDEIYVKCPDDEAEIAVTALEWSNTKYSLNEKTKEVESEKLGTFTQYPLKLAWAITIHKSQGLTFERAIIDAQAAFAHGQVYVALSRCKSFEGVVLRSKLEFRSVKTDSVVKKYSEDAQQNQPTEQDLSQSKRDYQQQLVLELFDFTRVERSLQALQRVVLEHENSLQGDPAERLHTFAEQANADVFAIAKKFRSQLLHLSAQPEMPEENDALQERMRKAGVYFLEKLTKGLLPLVKDIPLVSDNQKVYKNATERLASLRKELATKKACLTACKEQFSTQVYLRSKADADLDLTKAKPSRPTSRVPQSTVHPLLYLSLSKWREKTAEAEGKMPFEVLPIRSLLEIVRCLPTSTATLKSVRGFGEVKIKRYGGEVIKMVEKYCHDRQIPSEQLDFLPAPKPPKKDTKLVSFELFRAGKSIDEIAEERSLASSTIEGHLAHFIGEGKLDIFELVEKERVEEIQGFYEGRESQSSREAREHFGEKYSYGEIKMVLRYMAKIDER